MVRLNKKYKTYLIISVAAILTGSLIWFVGSASIKDLNHKVNQAAQELRENEDLLSKKPLLQSEWESKKAFFESGSNQDDIFNTWVKDLLTLAQSQSLSLEKLEPVGTKTDSEGKRCTIFVSFEGDMTKFTQFIYQLIQKDPLSTVESFGVRQQEDSKTLLFELLLAKAIK
jgi:hypothetical protein